MFEGLKMRAREWVRAQIRHVVLEDLRPRLRQELAEELKILGQVQSDLTARIEIATGKIATRIAEMHADLPPDLRHLTAPLDTTFGFWAATTADASALNAARACEVGILGSSVLVVGAGDGEECRYFKERGAAEVHGVDVRDDVGTGYKADRVFYHCESAERMSLPCDMFDLVYCFATMEHVPRVDLAFREMARVVRPGGHVYCVAAPLWNSAFGHHKPELFRQAPWIHLLCDRKQILKYCRERGIEAEEGIESHVDYMLDPKNMNQLPSRAYVEACHELPGMIAFRNDLEFASEAMLAPITLQILAQKGLTSEELRATHHVYIGRKAA
jgi:SAM-dependent methyltransferase